MSSKKNPKNHLNLGDTEFQKKLTIYYSWVAPVMFFIISIAIFFDKALLTGLIILSLSIFLLPPLQKITSKIPKLVRVLIDTGLIALAFYSMNLYV